MCNVFGEGVNYHIENSFKIRYVFLPGIGKNSFDVK